MDKKFREFQDVMFDFRTFKNCRSEVTAFLKSAHILILISNYLFYWCIISCMRLSKAFNKNL